jgi:hypothetical protein
MLQHYGSEPSLAETLSDPVIQAVMAADAVDPAALDALLREAAHRMESRRHPSERPSLFRQSFPRAWR